MLNKFKEMQWYQLKKCLLRAGVTYQHLLELFYRLISNADAINLPDLISYMQSPWSAERMN